ncbi:MAG TPA: arsinothricin resistance N-acetyltransferase ArsN1 family B [Gammaproteobacteria bacterium]|nr:arsinothricin resistance N-acetyltransferase ArsN1 family B [Gammaproteobacteria bacterium]
MTIRACLASDAASVCAIYNHYVRETVITFEEEPVSEREMTERIRDVTARWTWLVEEDNGLIKGYAYASAWKTRSAYRFSVESTVYVAAEHLGGGIGTQLYRALLAALREQNVHYVTGGIALPNPASVALHERLGFRKNGHFSEVGFKLGRWVDVGYWELIL